MILRVKMVCLNFFFIGEDVCLHSMDCCFDSGVTWDTHVSSPMTVWPVQNTLHMILRVKMVCLNFFFIGEDVCLHSVDCCFDSGVTWDTHVSSTMTGWLKESLSCSLYRVRKVNALACSFYFVFFCKHLQHSA
jgi:hypothetical protein